MLGWRRNYGTSTLAPTHVGVGATEDQDRQTATWRFPPDCVSGKPLEAYREVSLACIELGIPSMEESTLRLFCLTSFGVP